MAMSFRTPRVTGRDSDETVAAFGVPLMATSGPIASGTVA